MTTPWVNYGLLAVLAALFVYEFSRGEGVLALVERHGFVNADLAEALLQTGPGRFYKPTQTALTSLFLHAGWLHVGGNLLYLRVFGDNIEDRFGHVLYLMFFLLAGLAGVAGHYLADPNDARPLIGASGAIAGVMGAYIAMFPTARVVTLFPVFIFLTFIEVPALVFVGIWAAQQLLTGFFLLQDSLTASVPWFAHLGGFAFGLMTGIVYQLTAGRVRRRRAQVSG